MVQKISRKKLLKEPDEFMTVSSKLIQWATDHTQQVAIAAIGIMVIVAVSVGIHTYIRKANSRASALLAQSLNQYETAIKADNDPVKAYQAVEKSFSQVVDHYSGRRMGQIAAVEFADICFRAGQYDRAVSLYQAALKKFDDMPFYKNMVLSGLGYAYEEKKDYPNALKYFEMLNTSPEASQKDVSLFNLATIYEKMGNKEKSKTLFAQIVAEFPNSIYTEIAKEKNIS
jgi:tetratricopeptide (TPR) repeat protein